MENARRLCRPRQPDPVAGRLPRCRTPDGEIDQGVCHVVTGREIQAVLPNPGEDPTYRQIEGRCMAGRCPYATIHRLASAGQVGGIGQFCIDWCLQQEGCRCGPIPHADNIMQRALTATGFVRCGTIYTEDGTRVWRTTTAARTDAACTQKLPCTECAGQCFIGGSSAENRPQTVEPVGDALHLTHCRLLSRCSSGRAARSGPCSAHRHQFFQLFGDLR